MEIINLKCSVCGEWEIEWVVLVMVALTSDSCVTFSAFNDLPSDSVTLAVEEISSSLLSALRRLRFEGKATFLLPRFCPGAGACSCCWY